MIDAAVLSNTENAIATVTLNRPAQLNALDEPTRRALLMALVDAANAPAVKVVILTGAGRAFCVGQDLAAADELEDCEDCVGRTYNPIAEHLAKSRKPVIAAVNGPAVGAGMGFALGCDLVLMAEGSFLSCAFGKVGLIPDSGASYFLARALAHQRAFEIATSGRRIAAVEAMPLGHPLDPAARLGPLASRRQQENVETMIEGAIERGDGRLVWRGEAPDQGFYVAPALFADVDPNSPLAQEEVFGPVLAIIPHDGDDDAVAIANNSQYGLAGAVWSADEERALRVARRMRTGQVDVNGAPFNPRAPFGGYGKSGYGREFGIHGIEDFVEVKAIQRKAK